MAVIKTVMMYLDDDGNKYTLKSEAKQAIAVAKNRINLHAACSDDLMRIDYHNVNPENMADWLFKYRNLVKSIYKIGGV